MKWNLGVFFGGASVEHEVSVISALQAMNSMKGDEYEIVPVYMAKDGGFYTGEALRKIENFKDIPALLKNCLQVTFVKEAGRVKMIQLRPRRFKKPMEQTIDFAFPVVHGTTV